VTVGPATPLLLVGPVTVDRIQGKRMPGGAVSYGAQVATAFGLRARILTIAGPNADLSPLEEHDVEVVGDPYTVTFEFSDSGAGRAMRVPEQPSRSLSAHDLPPEWETPGTVMISTLIRGDLDIDSFQPVASSAAAVGFISQGAQRELADDYEVRLVPPLDTSLVRSCSHSYSLFRSAREAALWPESLHASTRAAGARLVTTRGADGALIESDHGKTDVPVFPSASVVDATGAGDVFATALILALDEGEQAAAQIAAAFAAASVERIGPAPLPTLSEIKRRIEAVQRAADEPRRGACA